MIWLYIALIFILNVLGVYAYRHYALKKDLIAHPNERSSHTRPTPVGGGLIFSSLFLAVVVANVLLHGFSLRYALVFVPGGLALVLMGFFDDKLHLRARTRFSIQLLVSIYTTIALGYGSHADLGFMVLSMGWLGYIFVGIVILWSINVFNFMDGLDGFAATEAIFIFVLGGFFCWHAQGYVLAWLSWLLAASIAGFLYWNLPPARIFMGDTGSVFLGLMIPVFAFASEEWVGVPALLWFMLYTVFYFDATFTLVRRVMAGQKWYEAHRLHAYLRLHVAGWSHTRVLLATLGVNAGLGVLTTIAYFYQQYMFLLFLLGLGYVGFFYYLVECKCPMFQSDVSASA